ncbi:MAG: hypothetical protein WC551_09705 [Patescibacteria group bacterium]
METKNSTNSEVAIDQIRCSRCGRFMGYGIVDDGLVLLLCKNCKGWTILADGKLGSYLTDDQIHAIVSPS